MPKKGGKGKKGKGKSGGGGAAAAKPAAVTPGHQVEETIKDDLSPGTATTFPSAAPPQALEAVTKAEEDGETTTTETGDESTGAEEIQSPGGTAKKFSLSRPKPLDGQEPELLMPTSLVDVRGNTLEEAVDKVQAGKVGLVGTLDGGDREGGAVLPEPDVKESKFTTPLAAPETAAPATELVGAEKITDKAAVPATTGAAAAPFAEAALPDRTKEAGVTEPAGTAVSDSAEAGHVKRPHEDSLFQREEDHKPPKMAKVGEELEAAPAAKPSEVMPAAAAAPVSASEAKAKDLEEESRVSKVQVLSGQTEQPHFVPGLGAEGTKKGTQDIDVSGLAVPEKKTTKAVFPPTSAPTTAPPAAVTSAAIESTAAPTSTATKSQTASEALAPGAAPAVAPTAATTEASRTTGEDKHQREIRETLAALTEDRQAHVPKEFEEKAKAVPEKPKAVVGETKEKPVVEAEPSKVTQVTQETAAQAKPTAATAAAVAAMKTGPTTETGAGLPAEPVGKKETAQKATVEKAGPDLKQSVEAAKDKAEEAKDKIQGALKDRVSGEAKAEEEAATKDTQQAVTDAAKKAHEEHQTGVDKVQEARSEAAKEEKRKSGGFFSWLRRKLK